MHTSFADWYQPVTFNHDREVIALRWNGVKAAIESIEDNSCILDIIQYVYGIPFKNHKNEEKFRQFFKDSDPTFIMKGNDKELLVLAGSLLALYCVGDEYEWDIVPLSILTMSICGTKKPVVEIDLIGMASEAVFSAGIEARKRPQIASLKKLSNKKTYEELATSIITAPQDWEKVSTATKSLGAMVDTSVNALQASASSELEKVYKTLMLQDEELHMLWWMVGGWSNMWNSRFSDIDQSSRPILLAIEAAKMTEEKSEPPSLQAVFSRVEISSKSKTPIPSAVNSCGAESLEKIKINSVDYPSVFPVHFAIHRALETGADESWINGWSKATGVSKDIKIDSLALAVQVHRECKLMSILNLV